MIEFQCKATPRQTGRGAILPPAVDCATGEPADRNQHRPRLAILSTTSELCGIAAYTRSLQPQLSDVFDITVFDLDQYLLRSGHPRVRKLGDRHIREICGELASFDAVNVQLEHGILGMRTADICRRFAWIVAAAPAVSVTFHTMFWHTTSDTWAWLKDIAKFDLRRAAPRRSDFRRRRRLAWFVARQLRQAQRRKPVAAIVHSRRDRREIEHVQAIVRVYDHPLCFLSATAAEEMRSGATRQRFPLLNSLPKNSVLIGMFGFLSPYKGFEAAIRAMQHLPEHYHLLVFGAVHPNMIAAHESIDPYLLSLLNEAYVDTTLPERLARAAHGQIPPITVTIDRQLKDLLLRHPRDLSSRLHFMGAMKDRDFLAGMTLCDTVVFPYLEVGQSSSGPISQAVELGCRIIASRTRNFLEFARYHPDRIEFFDIGNHLELAERLLAPPEFEPRHYRAEYDVETNRSVYRAANGSAEPSRTAQAVAPALLPAAGPAAAGTA
jgi:glycosyltransferase involved in cell wall biosynthesis